MASIKHEKDLLKYCLESLTRTGLCYWRMSLGGVLQQTGYGSITLKANPMKGLPDVCGVTSKGVFWGLELKSVKGRLSPQQVYWHEKLSRTGAIVGVARSPEEVGAFLSRLLDS